MVSPHPILINTLRLTDGRSPYGFTITPSGRAISFCKAFVEGSLSVVILNKDLSLLNSSSECPVAESKVCCEGCYYCYV